MREGAEESLKHLLGVGVTCTEVVLLEANIERMRDRQDKLAPVDSDV